MTTGNHATRDALERALADGGGVLRLEPAWVARGLPTPRTAPGTARGGLRRGRARLHLRALARLDHEGRQPRGPARRGAELPCPGRRRPADPPRRGRDGARPRDGPGLCGDPPRPGTAGQDLRLRRPDPVPHPPARRVRGAGRTQPQGRGVLLPLRRRHGPPPRVVLRGPSLDRGASRVRRPAAVSRRLGQRPDPAARARGAARRRGGLPHPRRASSMPRAPR